MPAVFVWMYNATLDVYHQFPAESAYFWQTKGWAYSDAPDPLPSEVPDSLLQEIFEAAGIVGAARDAALAAAAAAQAVGSTNDTVIAGRIADPTSATSRELLASIAGALPTPTQALAAEQRAPIAYGRAPRLCLAPPTVTVKNNGNLPDVTNLPNGNDGGIPGEWFGDYGANDINAFRFLGCNVPIVRANPFPNGSWDHVTTAGGPGGIWTMETNVTGHRYIEWIVKTFGGTAFRILVDNEYVTSKPVILGGDPNGYAAVTVDLGEAPTRPRTVTFECNASSCFGVNVAKDSVGTLTRVAGPKPKRLLVLGDSYTGGANIITGLSTYARMLGWLLGYRDTVNSGLGSTGFLSAGASFAGYTFRDRAAHDVVGLAPDAVLIAGGHNDSGFSNAAIRAEVTALLQVIRNGLPEAKIAVAGPLYETPDPGAYAAMQAAIFAGADDFDSTVVKVDTTSQPFITLDNIDRMILRNSVNPPDPVHPTQVGHDYFAHRFAAPLAEAGFYAS